MSWKYFMPAVSVNFFRTFYLDLVASNHNLLKFWVHWPPQSSSSYSAKKRKIIHSATVSTRQKYNTSLVLQYYGNATGWLFWMAINDLKASGQRWALSESIWNIQDSRFHLWVFQKNTATSSQVAKIFKQKPRATSWITMQCWPKGLNFILVHSREHLFLLCEMQYKQFDYFSLIASSIFIVLQFQSGIIFLSCWNCSWLNIFFSMQPITWRIQPKLEIILKILHVLNLPFIAHVHSLTKQSNQIHNWYVMCIVVVFSL